MSLEDDLLERFLHDAGPGIGHRRVPSPSPGVAGCSCGWRSVPARSPDHVELRWRIHLSQRRSATWIDDACVASASARQRVAELRWIRDAARDRRRSMRRQRRRVQVALDRARGTESRASRFASLLEHAREMLGCTIDDLWWDYFTLGGSRTVRELAAVLAREEPLDRVDEHLLTTALNERFAALGFGHPVALDPDEDRRDG